MTPEERRAWRRHVFGADLTAAQRLVLLALESFADYHDGTNARPGEALLASICNLQPRAVRYALDAAEKLGLISVTANSRRGSATVYRLVPVEMTGTAMPPNTETTGTAVPPNGHMTGTTVPPNGAMTGTAKHDDRHGDNRMTGTAMPVTNTGPNQYQANAAAPAETTADDSAAPPPQPPANSNPAAIIGPHGPRCRRHAHLKHHPPDCAQCRHIQPAMTGAAP